MSCNNILLFLANKSSESRKVAKVLLLNLLAFFNHSLNETSN